MHADHAGDVVDGFAQVRDALVVQALARQHADRLRDILHRLLTLADGDSTRRVGTAAFRGGALLGLADDGNRGHGALGSRGGIGRRRGGGRRRGHQHIAGGRLADGIAAATQQRGEAIVDGVAALQAGAMQALYLGGVDNDGHARLLRITVQGAGQRAGGDAVAGGGGRRLGESLGVHAGTCQQQGGQGQRAQTRAQGVRGRNGNDLNGHGDSLF